MVRKRKKQRIIRGKCPFCQSGNLPDYKKPEALRGYLTDRGRIVSRVRSGVCAKHQRYLAREIKRARYLALLPFMTRV
jgi:small subunit ribosomal protein S18